MENIHVHFRENEFGNHRYGFYTAMGFKPVE